MAIYVSVVAFLNAVFIGNDLYIVFIFLSSAHDLQSMSVLIMETECLLKSFVITKTEFKLEEERGI